MRTLPIRRCLAPVLAFLLAASGCSTAGPTPEELASSEAEERRGASCDELAIEIADVLQGYVDRFAPTTEDGELVPQLPDDAALEEAIASFRQRRDRLDCDPRAFQTTLNRAVDQVQGSGPLGRAVVAEVRDRVVAIPGPAATVTVEPGDDLAAAVHGAGPGAVVRLAAGRHELDGPLVTLRATSMVGAGSGRTTLVAGAAGSVLLHLGAVPLSLEGLAVVHEGDEAASVVVVASGGYRLQDVELRGGVADEERSAGWGLVLGGGDEELGADDDEALQDVAVRDNEAGGIVAVDRTPAMTNLTATGNGGCGVCYLGAAGGSVTGGTLTSNLTGVSVAGAATPELTDVSITGNSELGILVEGTAAPAIEGATVTDNGPVGIAVTGDASVTVRGGTVTGHGEAGLLAEGDSTASFTGADVGAGALGVLVRDRASAAVVDVAITDVADASIVFAGQSGGTVEGGSCAAGVPQVVLLDATTVDVGTTPCEVLDQRGATG